MSQYISSPSATMTPIESDMPATHEAVTAPVLRLSDLAPEEKELMMHFLIDQNIEFHSTVGGNYAARVRMYDASVLEDMGLKPESVTESDRFSTARRTNKPRYTSERDILDALAQSNAIFDFSNYRKFTSLIGMNDKIKPKQRPLAWVMRLLEEVYDARYTHDTAELREEEENTTNKSTQQKQETTKETQCFAPFVVEFFTKRYGLRQLVDQTSWDLLYNIHLYRRDYMEVDLFAQFLEETYDPDDLLFFLYVRSVIQRELNFSFRARWTELGRNHTGSRSPGGRGPQPLFLSYRECCVIARIVFGSESEPLYRSFLSLVETQLQGEKKGRTDERRMEVTRFLDIALTEYHSTRPDADGNDVSKLSNTSGTDWQTEAMNTSTNKDDPDELFREAEQAYEQRLRQQQQQQQPHGHAESSQNGHVDDSEAFSASNEMLAKLGECMHRGNNKYLEQLLKPADDMPNEVINQIRTEVEMHLEDKVDSILERVIASAQSGVEDVTINSELVKHFKALLDRFATSENPPQQLEESAKSNGEMDSFCQLVLQSDEIKHDVAPLVDLLVSFARARLASATTTQTTTSTSS